MAKTVYFLKHLIRIDVVERTPHPHIKWWAGRKKSLFRSPMEPGFYWFSLFADTDMVDSEDLKKYIVEDKTVFFKPYVKLNFNGGISYSKSFDTMMQAEDFENRIRIWARDKVCSFIP